MMITKFGRTPSGRRLSLVLLLVTFSFALGLARAADDVAAVVRQADQWRAEHRFIDLHQHMDYTPRLAGARHPGHGRLRHRAGR